MEKCFTTGICKADQDGQSVYGFRITSPAIDRDKEILDPAGMDAANYLLNPVILWGHDMDEVVGKAVNLRQTETGWEADIVFADAVSEKAREVKALVDGGFVSATSVRFRPENACPRAELKERLTSTRLNTESTSARKASARTLPSPCPRPSPQK